MSKTQKRCYADISSITKPDQAVAEQNPVGPIPPSPYQKYLDHGLCSGFDNQSIGFGMSQGSRFGMSSLLCPDSTSPFMMADPLSTSVQGTLNPFLYTSVNRADLLAKGFPMTADLLTKPNEFGFFVNPENSNMAASEVFDFTSFQCEVVPPIFAMPSGEFRNRNEFQSALESSSRRATLISTLAQKYRSAQPSLTIQTQNCAHGPGCCCSISAMSVQESGPSSYPAVKVQENEPVLVGTLTNNGTNQNRSSHRGRSSNRGKSPASNSSRKSTSRSSKGAKKSSSGKGKKPESRRRKSRK